MRTNRNGLERSSRGASIWAPHEVATAQRLLLGAFLLLAAASFFAGWAEAAFRSRALHVAYVAVLVSAAGLAARDAWARFSFDRAGQSLLVAAALAGLAIVFLPRGLLDPGGDPGVLAFGPAARIAFSALLLLSMANPPLPRFVVGGRSAVVAAALGVALVVHAAAHSEWIRATLGPDPVRGIRLLDGAALEVQLLALAVVWLKWLRSRTPQLATLGQALLAMTAGTVLFLFSSPWEIRWWVADLCMVVAPGVLLMGVAPRLCRALDREELVVHYQPKVDLRIGRVAGVEALVRWRDPERGLVLPGEFVPAAEQCGLIRPLSRWVLRTALRQHAAWRREGLYVPVAVNLSARMLDDPDLVGEVREELDSLRLAASVLTLEITETAVAETPERAAAVLGALHDLGVRLSVDDYGTGYAFLASLKHLPFQELKIDRSFVANLATDDHDFMIVRSTVELGHLLGKEVVAEGVQSEQERDLLVGLGCDLAQGPYWIPPQPAEHLTGWLKVFSPPPPGYRAPAGNAPPWRRGTATRPV